MTVVGVDACKTGWIAVEIDSGGPPRAHFLRHITEVVIAVPSAEVIAVDIPIGLPVAGQRRADLEAKKRAGPRRNSVFITPLRQVLSEETHAAATRLSKELTGLGISQQSWALKSKILEVDAWIASSPCRVVEVHPEISFGALLGHPATATKKSWAGMMERRNALAVVGIDLDEVGGQATLQATVDDMLDAAVAAWTARRVRTGEAECIPDPPEEDDSGTLVAIWA